MTPTSAPAVARPAAEEKPGIQPSDWPMFWPRQGIAAAQVVNRFGWVSIKPIIVVDFYRQADPL